MENVRELDTESARAILSGLAIQQRERATALSDLARLRKEASAEIDRLIAFLDASDPYVSTELEQQVDDSPCDWDEREISDGDDEPDLGFLEAHTKGDYLGRSPWDAKSFNQARYQGGSATHDNEGDDSDDEPSLGSLDRHPSLYGVVDGRNWTGDQTVWAGGGTRDLEDEHDGAEPDGDAEPSLGWTTGGVMGGLNDRERDDCDREDSEPLLSECV
jgi:hypothetical protein